MDVLTQYAGATPGDFVRADHVNWSDTPKRDEPVAGSVLDDQPGWVNAMNIMGTVFSGYDHYAPIDEGGGACRMVAWKDDPEDYDPSQFFARDLLLLPCAPDPRCGGAISTRGETTLYCAPGIREIIEALGPIQDTVIRNWSEFVPPPEGLTRHGIWLDDELHDAHHDAQSLHSWREWSDGVDPRHIGPDGRILAQGLNKPRGTITYFQTQTSQAETTHNPPTGFERALESSAGAGEIDSSNLAAGASAPTHVFSTVANQPNSAAWPTGGGAQAYEAQFNISTLGADMTCGLRTAGTAPGHFARQNSALSSDLETHDQAEALFAAPAGLKLASYSGTWTAGAADNRFEILLAATRAASHGSQSIALTYDSDAFARGPWAAGGRIMSSLAGSGGLAARGGIAGPGGGLAA